MLFPEGKSKEKWQQIRTSDFYKEMVADLIRAEAGFADRLQGESYALFTHYWKSGERAPYETAYFEKRRRLNTYATLALLYPENERYIRGLKEVIWAICGEFTWCLPNHLGGQGLPVAAYLDVIDLFSAETASALAEIKYLLGDRLSGLIQRRIRHELGRRIVEPYLRQKYQWETAKINWNAVCNAGVGMTLLYEFPEVFETEKQRILDSLNLFIAGYGEDGACPEGLAYWAYGFGYYVCFAKLLRDYTGGALDLLRGEKLRNIAMFQQRMYLNGRRRVTFADTNTAFDYYYIGLAHFLKREYPGVRVPNGVGVPKLDTNDNCYRWALHIRNFVWASPDEDDIDAIEETNYFADVQWYTALSQKHDAGLAVQAGYNGRIHGHHDIGSFIYVRHEDVVINDLGSGQYSQKTFGKERFELFTHSSRGHSVPIINGQYQIDGPEVKGLGIVYDGCRFQLDMSAAYPQEVGLERLDRCFVFGEALAVTDEYRFSAVPGEVTERFITRLPVEISDGRVLLTGERGRYEILYDAAECAPKLGFECYTALYGKEDKGNIIDFVVKNPKKEMKLEFKIITH